MKNRHAGLGLFRLRIEHLESRLCLTSLAFALHTIDTPEQTPFSGSTPDVDGDGDPDLLAALRGSDLFSTTVCADDFDGDGDLDVFGGATLEGDDIVLLEQRLPGDVNGDGQFNQLDVVQVLQAGSYLTAESATWEEGDWNGDSKFDQLDVVAALARAAYQSNSQSAITPGGSLTDGRPSIVYNPATGELSLSTPTGGELSSIDIDSESGIFVDGESAINLDGRFDRYSQHLIFKATPGASFGSTSFGNVAQTGLAESFVVDDLTVQGTYETGRLLSDVDLVYVTDVSGSDFSNRDLTNARFEAVNLSGADFRGANLTGATFFEVSLSGTDFRDAIVAGADFSGATNKGFTAAQLYSTASYQAGQLNAIDLSENDMAGWDFTRQDLTGALLESSDLRDAVFSGADLTNVSAQNSQVFNASFEDAIVVGMQLGGATGLDEEQLYASESYRNGDLRGIRLPGQSLSRWDFSHQNLGDADFASANLDGANFRQADIAGASFNDSVGFTWAQFSSTESYATGELAGVVLEGLDLAGWDFSEKDLSHAFLGHSRLTASDFSGSDLTGADFTGADLRGSRGFAPVASTVLRNVIRPDGRIEGLDLGPQETLVVHNYSRKITIQSELNLAPDARIELVLDSSDWKATLQADENVTPRIDGTLYIRFESQTDPASLIGASFDLFDWPGSLDPADLFVQVDVPPGRWDLSALNRTGKISFEAMVEPGDADGNGQFDQIDLVNVQIAAKYLTGQPATWAEGDFNGDGVFDPLDIVLTLQTGNYFRGHICCQ